MTDLITIDRIKEDEEHFVRDLIETKGKNLPQNVEQVLNVFEFTDWKAKAWKTLADKMSRLEDQSEAYHSALRSGQQWGIAALYAQKRMGEITREISPEQDAKDALRGKYTGIKKGPVTKGIYQDAERIASYPDILDRVIELSKETGEIPTKTAVLNTIRVERSKSMQEQAKKKSDDKLDNQRPQAVADYYEAVKGFKAALELAMIAAERGKFAPEGKNFLQKKNNQIRQMMEKLEEMV